MASPSNDLSERIRGLEEELLEPATRASPGRLGELLADDFLEFGSSGRSFSRDEVASALAAEADSPKHFDLSDFALRVLAPEVVLATYRVVESVEGEARRSLRSSVWVQRTGRWQLVFHQGTLPGQGDPRA